MRATSVPDSHLLDVRGFEGWLEGVEGDAYVERARQWVQRERSRSALMKVSSNETIRRQVNIAAANYVLGAVYPILYTINSNVSKGNRLTV